MSRAEEGWDGPERFRCFVCRAKGMLPETIEHGRVGHMTVALVSAEAAQELADELRNAGSAIAVHGNTVTGMDMACPRIARQYEENPYLHEDGSEKYVLSRWQEFAVVLVVYAAATLVFNLMFRQFFPAVYELEHTCDACAFVKAWFESVFGSEE